MPKENTLKSNKAKKDTTKTPLKVSYYRKPEELTVDQWQIALRKQFAETKTFGISNLGNSRVFSDFQVDSSDTGSKYKVAIRSAGGEMNFCSCMDFKTNNLGTCKHIEHVLYKINEQASLAKILKKGYSPHYTSVYLQYKDERKVRIRIGSENFKEYSALASGYFDKNGDLKEEAIKHFETFLEKAYQLHPDFRCYTDALELVLAKRESQKREEEVTNALKKEDFFNLIKANLFPYQKEGIEFALRKGRSLIADDMGLGKTIQAIGTAEGMKKLFNISKVLIICPTSLKYQWKSEIEKFTESSVQVIEGQVFQREKLYRSDSFYKICSYNVVGKDIEVINKNEFDLVILDEAQRIKNWQTATAKNIKKIQTKYAVVLTGTPVENKLEELYSVLQMVNPFKLGALFRFLNQHQITDEATGKVTGYKDLNKIGELLKDSMIRRHKRDVLKQLPSRMDKNLFVPMTDKQMEYYNEAYEIVCKLVNKWVRYKFLSESDRQKLLINLNMMRMSCNSTFIIDQTTRHDTKIDELMSILDEVFQNGDEKVVIFSQWERMTRIVAGELDARKVKYENLNGGVPSKDREKLFSNFNKDPESKVFLSTDAGGVGLNLQAASILINLDLPWNPAVLEQRIGRIHRLGQKRNVQIINLIAANTIEQEMLNKLQFKSAMSAGILDNGESMVFLGESKFNALMKQVSDLTSVASHPITPTFEENNESIDTSSDKKEKEDEGQSAIENIQNSFFDDDNDSAKSTPAKSTNSPVLNNETEDLVQSGMDFFGKLFEALSDKNKTEKLVNSLVKTDKNTGETFLKIPVKNTETVENGLKILVNLLGKN